MTTKKVRFTIMAKEFSYEIKEHIATISDDGLTSLQVNVISFNGGIDKVDIRRWRDGMMLKGITMTKEEFEELKETLSR